MTAASLVGRDQPTATMQAELDRTLTSHGGLVLVSGEAGIGKTALVTDLARRASSSGALVLTGAAWDRESAPGYWPWVQVARSLQRNATAGEWATATEAAGEELCLLLGETSRLPDRAEIAGDATFRLHDAVSSMLVTASHGRPVVVLLDDLHWADTASIKLLEFLAKHTWFEQLLLVGTYRDVEVESAGHPLGPILSPLLGTATTVTLTGLNEEQVAELIARTSGRQPADRVTTEVHRRTGGNPFFVEQATRLWHGGDSIGSITPGIRETVETRLSYLPAEVVEVLTAAAVLGREFSREVLEATSSVPAGKLDALIEHTVAARLVTTLDHERFAFVHDLVREALYATLDSTQRTARHAAVTRGLERVRGHASSASSASSAMHNDLAHHAYLAIPEITPDRALEHILAAAGDACCRLAAEELATHYRRALELIGDQDKEQRARILLCLGSAQHSAGELATARATFEDVITIGRELGSAELLARATLGIHELGVHDPVRDGQREIELVDEAHATLIDQDFPPHDPLVVRTLAASARIRAHVAHDDRQARELSARALELGRHCGEDATLGFSLLARHDAVWEPGSAADRVSLTEEMTAAARRGQDTELELHASLLRMVALLEQGDAAGLDEHATFAELAHRSRLPRFAFLARSRRGTVAMLRGHFDEARVAIDEAFALGEQLDEADRNRLWLEQRWALALMQGDLDQANRLIGQYRADSSADALLPEVVTALARGDTALARRHRAALMAMTDQTPRFFLPAVLVAQAQLAIAVEDEQLRGDIHGVLAPLRGYWAVVAGGGTIYGPYTFWLARLDAAQQRWDAAIGGFEAAQASAERLQARPWSIEARLHRALALRARGVSGDAATALALLEEVHREAAELDMRGTERDSERALAEMTHSAETRPGARGRPQEFPDTPVPGNEFRKDGAVWSLGFGGKNVHMPDAKGLADLHFLLGRPGTEVPAADLLDPQGGETARASARFGADAVLDEKAKAAYRRRLTQLDEEIDHATTRHADERAAELDHERAALLEELRHATGLAGRSRRLGDTSERARKTVTARIRDTIRRIDGHHPELAEHLRATVSTGITCRYHPSRDIAWTR